MDNIKDLLCEIKLKIKRNSAYEIDKREIKRGKTRVGH